MLNGLADRIRTAAECPTSRRRSTGHMKRRGIITQVAYLHLMHVIELTSSRGNELCSLTNLTKDLTIQ